MYVLILTLYLASSPTALTSTSSEFLSEQSCNAAGAKLAKELRAAYAERQARVVGVCVPK